jgi:hypothetical protein
MVLESPLRFVGPPAIRFLIYPRPKPNSAGSERGCVKMSHIG